MWLEGTPTRIIAETLRITADLCDATRRGLKLPPRESWHNSKAGVRRAYVPTPDEIRRKCAEFQAGWSEEERSRRFVGRGGGGPVEIKVIRDAGYSVYLNSQDDGGMSIEDLADTSGE